MVFFDKKGHKLRHRGGSCYWCKICKESHIIEKWNTPDGPKYVMDPHPIEHPTEKQKEEFWDEMERQGAKRPKK